MADDKRKGYDGLIPQPKTGPKAANNHPLRFFNMEFHIYDREVDFLVWLNRRE
jgi:hypothetical protein